MGRATPVYLQEEILAGRREGISLGDLARRAGVAKPTVAAIVRRGYAIEDKRGRRRRVTIANCPVHGRMEVPCRGCIAAEFREKRKGLGIGD
jgi:hypothetical protein